MDDSEPVHWRRDATTSRTVRLLWSLGVGTFFAAIGIIVFWRLYDLAGQIGGQTVLAVALLALIATILALAVVGRTEAGLDRLAERLPIESASPQALERVRDAAVGAVAMGGVIWVLMMAGRIVSQRDLIELGAGPFTGLAALLIPLALVALVLASFLRSVGAFDRESRTIYLYDPDQAVDLEHIEAVSIRTVGDAAVLRLRYAQPDGQYVQGPRRIVVPQSVAREVESLVG
ncbi:hypothetical protein OB905_13555 [Halobacteria archaeon AArc-dxtr1]|nr:hypothetical protein [Halobacteria archaeon AArc-dxtr1]